jgi:hypothetical protein
MLIRDPCRALSLDAWRSSWLSCYPGRSHYGATTLFKPVYRIELVIPINLVRSHEFG